MTFQIQPIDVSPFRHLFALSDKGLEAQGARRMIADKKPGFPCRVSLKDADVGATMILCNFKHLDLPSPYAASHAVFIEEGADPVALAPGEIPDVLVERTLSLRGFASDGFMLDAALTEGVNAKTVIEDLFDNEEIAFVDIHFAQRGCFGARAYRV